MPPAQFRPGKHRRFGQCVERRAEFDNLAHPLAKGLAACQSVLDGVVVVKPAFFHIDGNHLPWPQRAFFGDIRLWHRHHANLGPGNQQTVERQHIAHRPQSVAVKPAADPAAIGHRQRRGPIPWLHHGVAIGVHVLPGFWQIIGKVRPCLGHQHGLGHRRGTARAHQNLEHRIERATVGCARRDDRLDILGGVAKGAGGHANLVAFHPVDVAFKGVDLAVMRQHPERLRQRPLRKCVGGIALVIDHEGGLEPIVVQIGVENRYLLGQHHAFVNDRPARQAAQVKAGYLRRKRRFFDPSADDVKLALELLLVDVLFAADQNLLDLGPGRVGLFAQHIGIHRHMAPAVNVMPHPQHFGFHDRAAAFLRAKIGARQKHLPHRDQLGHVGFVPGAADLIVEKLDRDLHMNARAIAGLAIGIDRTPVPDRLQRLDAVLNHLARRAAIDRNHQPDAARGMFILGAVEAVRIHPDAPRLFFGNPGGVKSGHGGNSSGGRSDWGPGSARRCNRTRVWRCQSRRRRAAKR